MLSVNSQSVRLFSLARAVPVPPSVKHAAVYQGPGSIPFCTMSLLVLYSAVMPSGERD